MNSYLLTVTETELQNYIRDSSLLENRIYYNKGVDSKLVKIGKAWQGILFVLTGQRLFETGHPLAAVLFGNRVIDENRYFGYLPAGYLTPAQVEELNDQISNLTIADLEQKFDPVKMTELEVYPLTWDRGPEEFDWLSKSFVTVQNVYCKATYSKEAIIMLLR